MAHNLPKIEYGSTIPVVITFDMPEKGFGEPEQFDAKERVTPSISGLRQVSIDNVEVSKKVTFQHLSEAMLVILKNFFLSHAYLGQPFKYFEDQNAVAFTTYELKDFKFAPRRTGIAGENSFFYELPLTFRRVEDEEIIDYMEATINNGQAAAANVAGLLLDHTDYVSVKIFFEIVRATSSDERVANGFLTATYKESSSTWEIDEKGVYGASDDHGLSFSMSGEQVQYTSDTMAGTGYVGVMRVKNFTIT